MSERAKYRGYLAEAEEKERELVLRMQGLVESLRDHLDPLKDVGTLRGEMIAQQALDFAKLQTEMETVRSGIARTKEILGR